MQENWISWGLGIFGVFVLAEVGALIYFIGKTEAVLNSIGEKLDAIDRILDKHSDGMYKDTDAARDFAFRDSQIKAIWQKIDEIKEKVFIR